jgi:hypothetical protein
VSTVRARLTEKCSLSLTAHNVGSNGALQNWSRETGVRQSRVLLTEADLDMLCGLRADLTTLVRSADQPHDATLLRSASVFARVC